MQRILKPLPKTGLPSWIKKIALGLAHKASYIRHNSKYSREDSYLPTGRLNPQCGNKLE